jgi:hypothetical protein
MISSDGAAAVWLVRLEIYRAVYETELLSNLVYDHQAAFLSD